MVGIYYDATGFQHGYFATPSSGTPGAGITSRTANQNPGRNEVTLILGWEGVQQRHRQIDGLPSFLEGD
jgi:hypothetical protein